MKLSVTLTEQAKEALNDLARRHSAKPSTITEAALMYFSQQPAPDREQVIRGIGATKKAYTKGRWRAAFWEAMRNEFWLPPLRAGRRNDFAPLTFVGFQLWFLLDSLGALDSEDFPHFNLQLMSNPMDSRFERQIQEQKRFTRDRSPYDAAREVAEFLREHARSAGILEEIFLSNGTLVRIDHAGGHWTSKPEIDPILLPIAVSGKDGSYSLEGGLRFTRTSVHPR